MKRVGKLNANTSLRILAAVGLLGTAISCGDLLKKDEDKKSTTPVVDVKETPISKYKVTSVAEGVTATAAAEQTAEGTAAVLTLTEVASASQVIAVTGTCPIGSFTAPGEYTTGAIKADCEVVLKAGATASFAFTADKLPKDGQAQFVAVPFGAFNLKKDLAGDCAAGVWTGLNYAAPVTGDCTATFQAVAAPFHQTVTSGSSANTKVVPTTSEHTFGATITPVLTDLVEGSGYAIKFEGTVGTAATTASNTPAYKIKNVISTTCPIGSEFDYKNQVYRVATLSNAASCDVSFAVENPCGDAGVDASAIRFSGSSASARIDRIITKTDTDIESGIKGVGTMNCANSSCHGSTSMTSSFSRWKIQYSGATAGSTTSSGSSFLVSQTAFGALGMVAASSTSADNEGKIIQSDKTPASAWIKYDPLNSRFYRKVTPGFLGSARMPKVFTTGTSSEGCTPDGATGFGGTCLTEQQANQICHWIWNGVAY